MRIHHLAIVPAVALLSGAAFATFQDPEASEDGFLGFRRGEELRYALGPPEALYEGESAIWTIRLDTGRRGADVSSQGVFRLEYERTALLSDGNGAVEPARWQANASAVINAHGFPLDVSFDTETDVSGARVTASARYRYTGERYEKRGSADSRRFSESVNISGHDRLDLEVPSGLFLFMPPSSTCVGVRSDLRLGSCDDYEPVFANPGLVALAMPKPRVGETYEGDFLLLMPKLSPAANPRPVRGPSSRGRSGRRPRTTSSSDQFERLRVSLAGDRGELSLGGRTLDAWRFEADSPLESIWVDDSGRVLRIDLEAQSDNPRELHIRLLEPTEQ